MIDRGRADLHLPAGSTSRDGFEVAIDPQRAGWEYTSLQVLQLRSGGTRTWSTAEDEVVVLPLAGAATVVTGKHRFDLAGRRGVFTAVSDFAYIPRDSEVTVASDAGGRFAILGARAERRLDPRYGPAEDVRIEHRGAGQCSRQVVNFCTPETFEADRLIAVEVLTPAGNWSSYPPHKHDEERDGETRLEEIYYFEVADGPTGPGMGYQRVYGTDDRPIDVLAEVRTGDVVLIPHGWHGPSMAVPGYDLYYLNAMAGPERAWRICDDPAHAWIRRLWDDQPVDDRLPLTTAISPQEPAR
jgi:5-deoxy-glucuronate isomerase